MESSLHREIVLLRKSIEDLEKAKKEKKIAREGLLQAKIQMRNTLRKQINGLRHVKSMLEEDLQDSALSDAYKRDLEQLRCRATSLLDEVSSYAPENLSFVNLMISEIFSN